MLHPFVDLAKALALALGTFELRPLVLLEELLDLALAILAIVLALVHASFVALVPSTIECFPKAIHHGGAAAARLHRLLEVAGLVAALHDFADDLDNVPVVLAAIADVIAFALADVIAFAPAVAMQSSLPREPLPSRQWRISAACEPSPTSKNAITVLPSNYRRQELSNEVRFKCAFRIGSLTLWAE